MTDHETTPLDAPRWRVVSLDAVWCAVFGAMYSAVAESTGYDDRDKVTRLAVRCAIAEADQAVAQLERKRSE